MEKEITSLWDWAKVATPWSSSLLSPSLSMSSQLCIVISKLWSCVTRYLDSQFSSWRKKAFNFWLIVADNFTLQLPALSEVNFKTFLPLSLSLGLFMIGQVGIKWFNAKVYGWYDCLLGRYWDYSMFLHFPAYKYCNIELALKWPCKISKFWPNHSKRM